MKTVAQENAVWLPVLYQNRPLSQTGCPAWQTAFAVFCGSTKIPPPPGLVCAAQLVRIIGHHTLSRRFNPTAKTSRAARNGHLMQREHRYLMCLF